MPDMGEGDAGGGNAGERVDVLIVTAVKEEWDAVLEVDTGGKLKAEIDPRPASARSTRRATSRCTGSTRPSGSREPRASSTTPMLHGSRCGRGATRCKATGRELRRRAWI